MGTLTAALLLAGNVTLQVWAQAPPRQTPPEQAASAGQKAADQNQPSEQPPSTQSAPATATTESPLEQFQNFSAIQNGGPLPGMDVDRYIYRSGNLMRMQSDADVPEYYITDLAKQQSHAVAARGCQKMGYAYKLSFPFFVTGSGITYDRVPIGEEKVDGHQCHVEDLIIHNPKNPVVMHFRLYEAEDLQGFPIKIENHREHAYPWVIHYKDVKLGPPDPSLFVVPDQCQSSLGFTKTNPGSKPSKTKNAPSAKPR
jgi:hypothetical protein